MHTIEFDRSYRNFDSYPHNLIQQDLDVGASDTYQHYIENGSPRLLIQQDDGTVVRFRDLHMQSGQGHVQVQLKETTAACDHDIKDWLGDLTQNLGLGAPLPNSQVASYRDPQCRMIFLTGASNRAALKITQKSLKRLLSYHQVMPSYVEILESVFGKTEHERNLLYFAFRDRIFLDGAGPGHQMPELGRSGKHFQLSYVLKTIACITPPTEAIECRRFSTRPAAFYHHFDTETGASLWLTTHGALKLHEDMAKIAMPSELEDVAGSSSTATQSSMKIALKTHVYNCTWALQGWSQFIDWFEARVKSETHLAVYRTSQDGFANESGSGKQLGRIQILEEKLNEVIIVIKGNIKMLESLRSFYSNLSGQSGFIPNVARKELMMILDRELRKIESSFNIALTRATFQSQLVSQRKKLVLQHLQELNIAKSESLTLDTRRITLDAQHEAVVMRIITIVTLIFLPATFVSTFFSTDVVKYQNAVQFSGEALERWLEVTLPLTALTFGVAGYFFYQSYLDTRMQKANISKSIMTLGKI